MNSRLGLYALGEMPFRLFLVMGMLLVTVGISMAGVMHRVDLRIHEAMMELRPLSGSREVDVVMLENHHDRVPDRGNWTDIVTRVFDRGAAGVVFLLNPDLGSSPAAPAEIWSKVEFSRIAQPARRGSGEWQWSEPEVQAARFGKPVAAMVAPVTGGRVVSEMLTKVRIDGELVPTVPGSLAGRTGTAGKAVAASYLINFDLDPAVFPRFDLDRLLQNGISREMLEGKVVLIGRAAHARIARWNAPVRDHPQGLTDLQLQAYATNTLLQNSQFSFADGWQRMGYLVGITLFSVLFCGLLVRRLLEWVLVPLWLAAILGYVFAHGWMNLLIPLPEVLLAQLCIFALYRGYTDFQRNQLMQELVVGPATRLQDKLMVQPTRSTDDLWTQIVAMVSQLLDLRRSIFLEALRTEPRVKEVAALGCSLEDIHEQRRDYRREPYTSALKSRGVTSVGNRKFLKSVGPDEEEFITPLLFAGEVQGFWCFSLKKEGDQGLLERENAIRVFSGQIAELLHQTFQREQMAVRGVIADEDVHLLDGRTPVEYQVRKVVHLMERKFGLVDGVLNGLSTATIVYNLFGHVLQVNVAMSGLLEQFRFRPFESTARDFICHFAGMSPESASQLLRYVIIEHTKVTVPVTVEQSGHRHVLAIHAITHGGDDQPDAATADAMGLVFELIDVSSVDREFKVRETLGNFLNTTLRNHIESLFLCHVLMSKTSDPERQQSALESMRGVLVTMRDALNKADQYLETPVEQVRAEAFPIDVGAVLANVISAIQADADAKVLRVDAGIPQSSGLVLAETESLERGLKAILNLLIDDCSMQSEISISMHEEADRCLLRFENRGIGIPNEKLEAYLSGAVKVDSDWIREIRKLFEAAQFWGAETSALSKPGRGYDFNITLVKVI